MGRVKRIWYLLPMRAAKVQASCASAQSRQNLRCSLIQAVSHEEPSDTKPDPWPLWMAGHAQLKFVMTECSKTQIRLTRPIWYAQTFSDQYYSKNNSKFNLVVTNGRWMIFQQQEGQWRAWTKYCIQDLNPDPKTLRQASNPESLPRFNY